MQLVVATKACLTTYGVPPVVVPVRQDQHLPTFALQYMFHHLFLQR